MFSHNKPHWSEKKLIKIIWRLQTKWKGVIILILEDEKHTVPSEISRWCWMSHSHNAADWDYMVSTSWEETSVPKYMTGNSWTGKGDMDTKFQQDRLSGGYDPSPGHIGWLTKMVRMPVRHPFCTDYSSSSHWLGLNIRLEKTWYVRCDTTLQVFIVLL